MQNTSDRLACIGLALGAALGLAGSLVGDAHMRAVLWGIDGAGLVMAASLLAVKYLRQGKDVTAAGFLVFAIGEGVIVSSAASALDQSGPAFAGGTALWAAGLLLISVPKEFPLPVRLLGILAALLFAATSLMILSGTALTPLTQPLPFFAYPVFVLTIAGWIWTLMSRRASVGL
jgi:hypothetical protein